MDPMDPRNDLTKKREGDRLQALRQQVPAAQVTPASTTPTSAPTPTQGAPQRQPATQAPQPPTAQGPGPTPQPQAQQTQQQAAPQATQQQAPVTPPGQGGGGTVTTTAMVTPLIQAPTLPSQSTQEGQQPMWSNLAMPQGGPPPSPYYFTGQAEPAHTHQPIPGPQVTDLGSATPPPTPVAAQQAPPSWYDQYWQLVSGGQPQFGQVMPTGPGAWHGQLGDLITGGQPQFGQVMPTGPGAWHGQLGDLITGGQPQFGQVAPTMPGQVQDLQDQGAQFAQGMMDAPGRYDTELFQELLDLGLGRLDQAQERDRLNLLRDSMRRLGPSSGQLTNEYIDLAAEYDRGRNEFLANLAREAAMTQSQDRLAALAAARGMADDIFGREQSLRGEERQERDFQFQDRLRQIQEMLQYGDMTDRMGRADRAEERQERDFQFQDRLRQIQEMLQYGDLTDRIGRADRAEAREERDFQFQDRLRQIQEMLTFGQMDRQLGLDARDTAWGDSDREHQRNMDRIRAMQQEYLNQLELLRLIASMPGAVDETGGGVGLPGGGSIDDLLGVEEPPDTRPWVPGGELTLPGGTTIDEEDTPPAPPGTPVRPPAVGGAGGPALRDGDRLRQLYDDANLFGFGDALMPLYWR